MQRHSKQRDAVYQAVCSVRSHPTALQVYDIVRSNLPNISLATVYRNLKGLAEDGKVITVFSNDSVEHYDAVTYAHHHLCCTKCNKIYDVQSSIDIELDSIDSEHKIAGVRVMFTGVCENCIN